MESVQAESAVNTEGEAAIFVAPLRSAPTRASFCGSRVVLHGSAGDAVFRIAKEAARAAKSRRQILVVEIANRGIVRDTLVPV